MCWASVRRARAPGGARLWLAATATATAIVMVALATRGVGVPRVGNTLTPTLRTNNFSAFSLESWEGVLGISTAAKQRQRTADAAAALPLVDLRRAARTPRTMALAQEAAVRLPSDPFPLRPPALHFVHIPKSGGSAFTALMRRAMGCDSPPGICCVAPGDPKGSCPETRTCDSILGCTGHQPRLSLLAWANATSLTMLRDPVARLVSAWHYPGHHRGASFREFAADPQFRDLTTKMLAGFRPYGEGSFRGVCTPSLFLTANETLHRLQFVGLQELFGTSAVLFLVRVVGRLPTEHDWPSKPEGTVKPLVGERGASAPLPDGVGPANTDPADPSTPAVQSFTRVNLNMRYVEFKRKVFSDPAVLRALRDLNAFDERIFGLATKLFCNQIRASGLDRVLYLPGRGSNLRGRTSPQSPRAYGDPGAPDAEEETAGDADTERGVEDPWASMRRWLRPRVRAEVFRATELFLRPESVSACRWLLTAVGPVDPEQPGT